MKNTAELKKKFTAAKELLSGDTTTRGKVKSLMALMTGVNPTVDALLKECIKHLDTLQKIEDHDVVQLSADMLPETTEEEKKRKRALLGFIRVWKDLTSEINRVSALADTRENNLNTSSTSFMGQIVSGAKGPLAIITLVAVAVVALQATAVEVTIKNEGCGILETSGVLPPIPGFSLPKNPIGSGESGQATLPPISFEVDGSDPGVLVFNSLGFDLSIKLSNAISNVFFNDTALVGTTTDIRLSEGKDHILRIVCT